MSSSNRNAKETGAPKPGPQRWALLAVALTLLALAGAVSAADMPEKTQQLAQELASQGWLLFAAKTSAGDYDLFLSRPDGSDVRNLTRSPSFGEFGGRFSPDGKKILYRMTKAGEAVNHDSWGAAGVLVVANADGTNPEIQGAEGELPWACWSPDMRQFSCLYKREGKIRLLDARTKQVLKEMPRQGIFQQMYWSSDGQQLCGTANRDGQDWNIVALDLATGKATLLSRNLACTADFFRHDPARVIYSNRVPGLANQYGWTMLMQATADGKSRSLLYAERGKHVYYGCTSPDDRYAAFSVPESDGGTDSNLAIIRLADAPIVVPEDYRELRALYPDARSGPVFRLPRPGFEPDWTYATITAGPNPAPK